MNKLNPTPDTCATCRFWRSEEDPGTSGICKFNPPVTGAFPKQPETWPWDWCGKHQPHADINSVDRQPSTVKDYSRQRSALLLNIVERVSRVMVGEPRGIMDWAQRINDLVNDAKEALK